jgi:hypothetical protein
MSSGNGDSDERTFSGNDATTSGSALTVGNVPGESVGTALLNFVTIAEIQRYNSAVRVTLLMALLA